MGICRAVSAFYLCGGNVPNETTKSYSRRQRSGDFERFFQGRGIDIGCGTDPVTSSCVRYDKMLNDPSLGECDASKMEGFEKESFDWVYSSHCLEHFENPFTVLDKWWGLVKPNGYLILVVPDFALYEHKNWPSLSNKDHKSCFSIILNDTHRYNPQHYSMASIASELKNSQVIRIQLNEDNFLYSDDTCDQTRNGAQAEIEMVLRKQPQERWL